MTNITDINKFENISKQFQNFTLAMSMNTDLVILWKQYSVSEQKKTVFPEMNSTPHEKVAI